jgi:integron integrase
MALRLRHYSRRTEEAYVAWVRRYILFHRKRHPAEMGPSELTSFLSSLATTGRVAASTQNQALSALLFLYREVLELEVPWLDGIVRAKRPQRLPIVLTRQEVLTVLRPLQGTPRLMAHLLYGSGLRLLECCRLRVQDVDFERNQIVVRGAKGDKDRATMLPAAIKGDLARHLQRVRALHQRDLQEGAGRVELPSALARKYPNAAREWVWQWVFPATRTYRDRATGGAADITCTSPCSSGWSRMRCVVQELPSGPRPTPCAIPSPLTCWRMAATSVPCKSSSGIET